VQDMEQLPPTLQFLGSEKKREEDPVLRMMCIEILLLLSTSQFRLQSHHTQPRDSRSVR
jgi:hypothetical protein